MKRYITIAVLIILLIGVASFSWTHPRTEYVDREVLKYVTVTPAPVRIPGETKYFESIVIKEVPVDRIIEVPGPVQYVYVDHTEYIDRAIYITPTPVPGPTVTPAPTPTPCPPPKPTCPVKDVPWKWGWWK